MSDSHPPLDRFMFSLKAGDTTHRDLDLQIEALEERINALVRKVEVNGIPLLGHILNLSHDRKELDRLGKALVRCAELLPELDKLRQRHSVLELAATDPGWLAATFGEYSDFTEEINSLTKDDIENL